MIAVLYTYSTKRLSNQVWNNCFNRLPERFQSQVLRYVRWQDRQACLFGKLLLVEGLQQFGFKKSILRELQITQYGRPFIENSIDFNISHSGKVVVCAFSDNGRIGIDVEAIRDIDLTVFDHYMTHDEWRTIHQSAHCIDAFFQFWTRKESLIKADGRGLSIPLDRICTVRDSVSYDGNYWYLRNVQIDRFHPCCLAMDDEYREIEIIRKELSDLQ